MKRKKHRYKETPILVQTIKEHIQNNSKEYLIVSIIFIFGIILGVIFINNTSQVTGISEYINSTINSLKTNNNLDKIMLLKSSVFKNILLAVILWIMGSTVIGILMVYIIIAFKGFSLGYTISSIIATLTTGKGILFILASMFIQYIIYIPTILALAVSGMKLYNSIMKDRRKENIKIEILRHTIFSLFMMILLIISSLIEVFVSQELLLLIINYI